MVYKEIEIDSTWQQPLGEIRVIQEEADGRKLIIHLYDNGTPLDLTGKTVSIYIQKPDDTIIYHSCEASGNQVTVILTLQMMAAFGITKPVSYTHLILIYTFFGGFLAVCWTDFIQGFMMLIALMVVPFFAVSVMGGFGETKAVLDSLGTNFLNPFYDNGNPCLLYTSRCV